MEKQLKPQLRFPDFKDEWKIKKLEKVAVFLDNKRKPIKSADRSKMQGEYPYYGASGIIDYVNQYIFDDELILLGEDGENILSRNLPLAFRVSGKCWINNHAHVLKPKDGTNIDFLTENLERVNYVIYNTGTAQPKLNKEICKSIPLKFPSLPEQQKIASFLTDVDAKITKLTKKKELLEQYKKGVMQKIFKQELRFKPDLSGVEGDDNGNEFPKWEVKKIKDLDFYISDGNYGEMYPKSSQMKKSGVPFIRANNIKNLNLVWDAMKFIDEELHSVLLSGHLKENDILITTRGEIGMLAYVKEQFNGANINAQICLLRCNESMDSKYLLYNLSYRDCQNQFKSLQTGSALKQLPKKSLGEIKVFYPCLEEQTKIANFLSDIDIKIEALNTKIENSKAFKKGLLQKMFV